MAGRTGVPKVIPQAPPDSPRDTGLDEPVPIYDAPMLARRQLRPRHQPPTKHPRPEQLNPHRPRCIWRQTPDPRHAGVLHDLNGRHRLWAQCHTEPSPQTPCQGLFGRLAIWPCGHLVFAPHAPREQAPRPFPQGQHPPATPPAEVAPPAPELPPAPPAANTDTRRTNFRPRPSGSSTGSSAEPIGRSSSITSPVSSHLYS